MRDLPSFAIPQRPERRYPFSGGVEYEGETTFVLTPDDEYSDGDLADLLGTVFEEGPYRYGNFLDLPMVVYLCKDETTKDVFRVSIRDGTVQFHVLPETESAGLRTLYQRLTERTGTDWQVRRESTA